MDEATDQYLPSKSARDLLKRKLSEQERFDRRWEARLEQVKDLPGSHR